MARQETDARDSTNSVRQTLATIRDRLAEIGVEAEITAEAINIARIPTGSPYLKVTVPYVQRQAVHSTILGLDLPTEITIVTAAEHDPWPTESALAKSDTPRHKVTREIYVAPKRNVAFINGDPSGNADTTSTSAE
ncbi:hypothetical protein RYH80_17955 [Halobaculum sp. MBLA0147]|uniref:hypothetical protein n=1 Tax=Halobaculum sp. MBLA0147 TaxID=3079934 RepID=UPI0035261018